MVTPIIRITNILMVGIISGILLAIWLGNKPKVLPYTDYTLLHRGLVDSYNIIMPLMGLITIILTLLAAFLQKDNKNIMLLLMVGAILLIAAGLITRFGNQPINSLVMGWDLKSEDHNWMALRDKWWSFHMMRTIATFLSFCLITASNVLK